MKTERYDLSFETLMRLAHLAKHGADVGKILVDAVDHNIEALCSVHEFQVAVGVLPRPADAWAPFILSEQEGN